MKKTIRDRSMFVVLSCVLLAVSIFMNSTRVATVKLSPEVETLVGQEAGESFTAFFTELQTWYAGKAPTAEGVTLTQEDYDAMGTIIAQLAPYWEACQQVTDAEDITMLEEYSTSLMVVAITIATVFNPLLEEETLAFNAEEWTLLGSIIDQTVAEYQV